MPATLRFLALIIGYVGGAALSVYGFMLFWRLDASQAEVVATGFPIVAGMFVVHATRQMQKRTAAKQST